MPNEWEVIKQMLRRHVTALLAIAFAVLNVAIATNAWIESAEADTCYANARTPTVNGSTKVGHSNGDQLGCTENNTVNSGDISLLTLSGGSLDYRPFSVGPGNVTGISGNTVGCAGSNVKSHIYINDDGHGTSDTSGYNSDCTY